MLSLLQHPRIRSLNLRRPFRRRLTPFIVRRPERKGGIVTEGLRVLGVVMLPAAAVAGLLVMFFDWRARLLSRIRGDRNRPQGGVRGNRVLSFDVLDVSRPSNGDRTFLQAVMSLAAAAGIALLFPLVMLVVGLPVVLAVRGVLNVIGWIVGAAPQ
jgi:hypothetical protein